MDANMDMALQALENDDQHTARALLRVILHDDPDNELAWLWLAEIAETDSERDTYLLQAHRISAQHPSGRHGAGLLGARARTSQPATTSVEPEPALLEPDPLQKNVPVSFSVSVDSAQPAPKHVPVSHSVRVAVAQPPASAPVVTPPSPALEAKTSALPQKGGPPAWVQWAMSLGVVLLIVVLIVAFILLAIFVLES